MFSLTGCFVFCLGHKLTRVILTQIVLGAPEPEPHVATQLIKGNQ